MVAGSAAGDPSDVSNSPAYAHVDALVAAGGLRDADAALYKAKYAKLHDAVLRTYDHEKNLLRRAKQLNAELLAEKQKLEAATARAQADSDAIGALRDDLDKGGAELASRDRAEAAVQAEADACAKQRAELERDAAAKERLQNELITPQLEALQRAVDEVQAELARQRAALARVQAERRELNERIGASAEARAAAEAERGALHNALVRGRGEPDKLKKLADGAAATAAALEADVSRLAQAGGLLDQEAALQARKRKELDEQRTEHQVGAERVRAHAEAREGECEQLLKRLELARDEASAADAERVRLDLAARALASEGAAEEAELARRLKAYNAALKRLRKAEVGMQQAQQLLPHARQQQQEAARQLAALQAEARGQAAGADDARREVDAAVGTLLQEEGAEQEQLLWLRQLRAEVAECHDELAALRDNDRALHGRIEQLAAAREVRARRVWARGEGWRARSAERCARPRALIFAHADSTSAPIPAANRLTAARRHLCAAQAKSRLAAKATKQTRDAQEELGVRELAVDELAKRHAEVRASAAGYAALYEAVKGERNKTAQLIQASGQALAEMREKGKILQNEVDILRRESAQKDAAFSKEHLEHQGAASARDLVRAELNRAGAALAEQSRAARQQAEEVRRLNSIINGIELDMLRVKRQYEIAVEDRNFAGIQLIDRNDELCILHEKAHTQEATLTGGERQLSARADEVRTLDLELARLVREVEGIRRRIPRMPGYEQEIAALQAQLAAERAQAERLSAELESPANEQRSRRLEGRDAEPEALAAKVALLDERLDAKQAQLLEKELVLEEVGALAARLRKVAVEKRAGALELATAVNEAQATVKGVTRKMMAAVSELSMYQATSIKLAHDNAAAQKALEACAPPARVWVQGRARRSRPRASLTRVPAHVRAPPPPRAAQRAEAARARRAADGRGGGRVGAARAAARAQARGGAGG